MSPQEEKFRAIMKKETTPEVREEIQEILENSNGKTMLEIFRELQHGVRHRPDTTITDHPLWSYNKVINDKDYEHMPVEYIVWMGIIARDISIKHFKYYEKEQEEKKREEAKLLAEKKARENHQWAHLKETPKESTLIGKFFEILGLSK